MALSNAEKQRRYRERALKDPDGLLLTRLQVFLSSSADATLNRICERTGKTKREIVEAAIIAFDGYADVEGESRLYEAGSSLSAFVLACRAVHAIEQISKNDPNAIEALKDVDAVLTRAEKQIRGL
jgi:hypothetical protein